VLDQIYEREKDMHVTLKKDSGVHEKVKLGFSWTVLFWSFFVPLFRNDFKWAAIMFVAAFISPKLIETTNQVSIGPITINIVPFSVGLVFAYIYNKIYIKNLLKDGYKIINPEDKELVRNYIF